MIINKIETPDQLLEDALAFISKKGSVFRAKDVEDYGSAMAVCGKVPGPHESQSGWIVSGWAMRFADRCIKVWSKAGRIVKVKGGWAVAR